MRDVSVLISVYAKEQPEYLEAAVMSMINQTLMAKEIVIVRDGTLTRELENTLILLQNKYPIIKLFGYEKNRGLGLALKYGVEKCQCDLIARMDTDDISVPDRLELQVTAFEEEPTLDIVGGQIDEFEKDPKIVSGSRRVPLEHNDIVKYQRRRSALNHVTVMFKKESVLKAGNYEHAPLMEDDALWLNMISAGCKMRNLSQVLAHVRVGAGMVSRRGGMSYFRHYEKARKKALSRNQIGTVDYGVTVLVQLIVCLLPSSLRRAVFRIALRN